MKETMHRLVRFTTQFAAIFSALAIAHSAYAQTNLEALAVESAARAEATAATPATPEQIIERVGKATELIAAEGEAAFDKFRGKDSAFIFGGTYLSVYKIDGTMCFQPMLPKMIGKSLMGLKDANGKAFFIEIISLAESKGRGWVEYVWPKPGQKEPVRKVAYVKSCKHGDTTYVVACGVYDLSDAQVESLLKSNNN